ncbi:MAG: DUF6293 family protein [Candidatus Thermoplasmatota archaeon]|nr:DUF6293 family protein [Candidatus Thermoplasmatota archaeon]
MYETKLRVHIVPVGFEYDRIIIPLSTLKADRVWLLVDEEDQEDNYYLKNIEQWLVKERIEYKKEKCSIRDLYNIMKVMRAIIEKEKKNNVSVNVSSGSKVEAMAGMLISMVMKGTQTVDAYYVIPERYNPSSDGNQMSSGCRDIVLMPSYPVEKPKQHLIEFLKLLKENSKPVPKRRLVEKALQRGLLTRDAKDISHLGKSTSDKEDKNDNSLYMKLNVRYLDPLEKMGLVEVMKEGGSRKVYLTEDGSNMLTFLG